MIQSVFNYPVSTLFDIEAPVVYGIPRYQREYTWGKWQWDALFEDLLENDKQYFLGSIICINQSQDALSIQRLELVDGQQRMTTLSLLMAAIYYCFNNLEIQLEFEQKLSLHNLKHKLVLSKNPEMTRLIPQVQNSNQQDYYYVLQQAGLLEEAECTAYVGNRRVSKAFWHFCARIEDYLQGEEDQVEALTELIEKVNTATLVKIEVASHSDAYTLFESLNNRGVPLTAIDLMKNKLLAGLEKVEPGSIDKYFVQWTKVLEALGDDYAIQERFFRQYYNAFKPELKTIVNVPVATKSNLIHVYEKLIAHDAKEFLRAMQELSESYAHVICRKEFEGRKAINIALQKLERIQGAPSYLLLLLLFTKQQSLELSDVQLEQIIQALIIFFVRRNTTDVPATRDLNRIFMDLAEEVPTRFGDDVYRCICDKLGVVSAPDDMFKQGLSGSLYTDNTAVCRYVLCAIEESTMTKETAIDLWAVEGRQWVWTIEHVFPQGENIPQCWIDMIANGDALSAEQYRQEYVHRLGNLTISGYNSTLGNKSFVDKRDRINKKGFSVGYKNGLFLNSSLAQADTWSVKDIEQRTDELVSMALELFQLPTPSDKA